VVLVPMALALEPGIHVSLTSQSKHDYIGSPQPPRWHCRCWRWPENGTVTAKLVEGYKTCQRLFCFQIAVIGQSFKV
jgi:hypothetical protein